MNMQDLMGWTYVFGAQWGITEAVKLLIVGAAAFWFLHQITKSN